MRKNIKIIYFSLIITIFFSLKMGSQTIQWQNTIGRLE
jgi:hypothetical protein